MQEEWKDIVIEKNGVIHDFSHKYEISNKGRVRNKETGYITEGSIGENGYM